jgi:hypothetical protein
MRTSDRARRVALSRGSVNGHEGRLSNDQGSGFNQQLNQHGVRQVFMTVGVPDGAPSGTQ